jgi:hypothetical protein
MKPGKGVETYWLKQFSIKDFCNWLTHDGRYDLARRNIRLRLSNYAGTETYWTLSRVLRCETDLYKYIEAHASQLASIEVGCLYPSGDTGGQHDAIRNLKQFGVFLCELRLDVDLNDYAPYRSCGCGQEKTCCEQCFDLFLTRSAIPVLRSAIAWWGLTQVELFFSGRRGIHMWIRDERCMRWTAGQRKVFYELIKHPPENMLRHWYTTVYKPILSSGVLTRTPGTDELMLKHYLAHGGQAQPIAGDTFQGRWLFIENHLLPAQAELWAWSFLHKLLGPKLDKNVTTDMHHLIKSPWSIHADTGNLVASLELDAPELRRIHYTHVRGTAE